MDGAIKLQDPATGKLLHSLEGHEGSVDTLSFSPDSRILASSGVVGAINLWDLSTGKLLHTLERHKSWVEELSFSPDGKTLASRGYDNTLKLWPILPEIMYGKPKDLLEQTERETGLKVKGIDVYPWNPATGEVSDEPLPRPF